MTRVLCIFALIFAAALPARAQDNSGDDGEGFVVRMIQDQLSGAGRSVDITGFSGGIFTSARLDRLTIADDQGVWLELENAELDWDRSALLRGRLEINSLTAGSITLQRLPDAAEEAPAPEASGFAIPNLAIAIDIKEIDADEINLGEGLLGEAVTLSLAGSAALEGGAMDVDLAIKRLDAPGEFTLDASYAPEDLALAVNLSLREPAGGIAARLMELPGTPAIDLSIEGTGPLDDYRADINLDTDGEDRLTGAVTLSADGEGGRRFDVDLGGDVTALVLQQYRDFFGPNVALQAQGGLAGNGALTLDSFALKAAALDLQGSARINAQRQPEAFDVTGRIGSADGARVDLPVGTGISVGSTTLDVHYDASAGDEVRGDFDILGLQVPGYSAQAVTLGLNGSISLGETTDFGADITFSASGLSADDEAVAQALGAQITGEARIDWATGAPIQLRGLTIEGESYGASGDLDIAPGDGRLMLRAELQARADDLSAFAPLTGTDLRGATELATDVNADLIGGTFRIVAQGSSRDLGIGVPQIDPLLSPDTTLSVNVERTTEGLTINQLELSNSQIAGNASGSLSSNAGVIDYDVRLANAGVFTGTQAGPVTLEGKLEMRPDGLYVDGLGQGTDLTTGIEPIDRLLAGGASFTYSILSAEGRTTVQSARVATDELEITASGDVAPAIGVEVRGRLRNSAIFTGGEAGALDVAAEITQTPDGIRIGVTGGGTDLGIGNPTVDPLFAGQTELSANVLLGERMMLDALELSNPQIAVTASGNLTEGARDVTATGRLANSAMFTGGDAGALEFDLAARQTGDGYDVTLKAGGQDIGIGNPTVDPIFAGRTDLTAALSIGERILLDSLQLQSPQLAVSATGELTEGARRIEASGQIENSAMFTGGRAGPLGFDVTAVQQGPDAYSVALNAQGQNIGIGTAAVDDLLRGQSALVLRATYDGGAVQIETLNFDGTAIDANAKGSVGPEAIDLTFDARLDNLGRLQSNLSGPLTVRGDVGRDGDTTRLDITADGPGGTTAQVAGRILLPDGGVDLDITGAAPLALANPFIAPNSLAGLARFDLAMQGQPGLDALSGRVDLQNAQVVLPELQTVLEDLSGGVSLSNGSANVDLRTTMGGGTITASGPVNLSAPYAADLTATLANVRVEREGLVSTRLDGQVRVNGPILGNGRVTGTIGLSETELRIPSGSLGGVEAIPEITHLNEPRDSRITRERAGLTGEGNADTDGGSGGGGSGSLALDLLIRSEDSIFIRGRGLDAELRGDLRLEGTLGNIQPVGQFDLVRGRLDILTKRLELVEGTLRLAGSFEPIIRLVARSTNDDYLIDIVVEGDASSPTVTFTSTPDLPQDEVLSQLFFGRELQSLSALQAASLALAVAELTGRSNGGVVGRLRENFGLDDLDVSQTEEGETAITAGKYLSENVYTDVQVTSGGETNLSINLDITDNIRASGKLSDDGDTSLGLFYQKDY